MNQKIVDQYRLLQQKLSERFPEVEKEARRWQRASPNREQQPPTQSGPKPGTSRFTLRRGSRSPRDGSKTWSLTCPAPWQQWGEEGSTFCIAKVGTGSTTEAFKAVGALAQQIRRETGIAMYRLFALQGAVARSRTPYADLINLDPGVMVRTVQREMGHGWGHITVLHFLTDLGLACKPDLHLVRTVLHSGWK